MADATKDIPLNLAIDHTLLKPEATEAQVLALCEEAVAHGFKAVCVNSGFVSVAARVVQGSAVLVCSVVGFPLGAMAAEAKAAEAKIAIEQGAREIDTVIPLGRVLAGDWSGVRSDLMAVREATSGATLKVIFETCLLEKGHIVRLCELCTEVGVDFVKTSTGFSTGGATLQDVALMRRSIGAGLQVKASGGIRDRETALAMIQAGASRLGTSSGVAIMQGSTGDSGY
jgi:deoxyribose-phosphate aldolase